MVVDCCGPGRLWRDVARRRGSCTLAPSPAGSPARAPPSRILRSGVCHRLVRKEPELGVAGAEKGSTVTRSARRRLFRRSEVSSCNLPSSYASSACRPPSHGRNYQRAIFRALHVDSLKYSNGSSNAHSMTVCGGGAKSPALLEALSGVLDTPIIQGAGSEVGMRGAAVAALIALDKMQLYDTWNLTKTDSPVFEINQRNI